jgi:predicted MFS family arabinose efflux permease
MSEMPRRKLILSLTATQAFNASVIPIGSIVGSLTAVSLAQGNQRYAGAPFFISLSMAAIATFFAGPQIRRWGYRRLLLIACALGMLGYLLAGYAALNQSLPLFLLAYGMTGPAMGLLGFSRYAAAEISEPSQKARAMGTVVLGSTIGAILGPWLATASGSLFIYLGWPEVLGPWAMGFSLYTLAGMNVLLFLHLKTAVLTQSKTNTDADQKTKAVQNEVTKPARTVFSLLRQPRIATAMLAGVAAQIAMIFIMAITPLHMRQCHYSMTSISWVLSSHFVGMYGLSFVSGFLADKIGRPASIALGAITLIIACLLAPHAHSVPTLMLALFLLGWGWSLCFLGASATMTDGLEANERGRVQGVNEALINLASSFSALSSGLAFATHGYAGMAIIGLIVSALPLAPWLARQRVRRTGV